MSIRDALDRIVQIQKGLLATVPDNVVADPSFERTTPAALDDWAQNDTATGSSTRDTSQAKYGDASLKQEMTGSAGSGEVIERTQVITGLTAGDVWSFGVWAYVTALSNCKAVFEYLFDDGGATSDTQEVTAVNGDFVQLTDLINVTVPAGATQVTLKVRLEATAASATGTAYQDGVMAVKAATLPETVYPVLKAWKTGPDASVALPDTPAFRNEARLVALEDGVGMRVLRYTVRMALYVKKTLVEDERISDAALVFWEQALDAFAQDVTLNGNVTMGLPRGDSELPAILNHGGQDYIGWIMALDFEVIQSFAWS